MHVHTEKNFDQNLKSKKKYFKGQKFSKVIILESPLPKGQTNFFE